MTDKVGGEASAVEALRWVLAQEVPHGHFERRELIELMQAYAQVALDLLLEEKPHPSGCSHMFMADGLCVACGTSIARTK